MAGWVRYYPIFNGVLGAVVFILSGKFSLTLPEMIVLAGISLLSGYLVTEAYRYDFLTRRDIPALSILALYGGFACVGNTLFLQSFSWYHVPLWLLCSLWFLPIALAFLYVTWRVTNKMQVHQHTANGWIFFSIFFCIWSLYLVAYYPGTMSEDSIDQWQQAIGASPLNNWHPVFHTLCIRLLITVYESPAIVALAQIVAMAAVAASYLVFLSKQGLPFKWLLTFAIVFALVPANGIYAITLWKDVAFTISLLWLTLSLAKLLTYKKAGIQLVLALLAVALFRHNGMVVYLLTIPWLYKHKATYISLILLIGIKWAISNHSTPNSPAVKLLAPIHGMAAVMHHTGDLPPAVQQKMQAIMPAQEWQTKFADYSVTWYLFGTNRVLINNLSRTPTSEVLHMYTTTLCKHPYYIIRERLNGTDYVWNITKPANAANLKYITGLKTNDLGLQQRGNSLLRTFLDKYRSFSEGIFNILAWRVGIYTIFLLLSIFFLLKTHPKRYLLVFMPWFGCTLSLIPAMIDQEYRYVYFVFVLFGFLWLTLLPKKGA